MRHLLHRANGLEIWLGLAFGLVALGVGSLPLWTPAPVPTWAAAALWLVVIGVLLGWNWRLRLILIVGLSLGLTAGWAALVQNSLAPPAGSSRYAAFVGVILAILLFTSILVRQAKLLWEAQQTDLQRHVALLDELTVVDARTGLYKLDKGFEVLRREIQRVRRNNLPLTVVRMRPRDSASVETWRVATRLVPGSLRAIDVVVGASEREIAMILPETGLEGAEIVVDRTKHRLEAALSLDVYTGLATFPMDAVTVDGLWEEAGYALDLALEAQIPVVSRRLMNSDAETAGMN